LREDEKTQNFISIAFLFTLTYAQHQHGSTLQSTERVKEIVFGILLAKIYLPMKNGLQLLKRRNLPSLSPQGWQLKQRWS
jgi:response regulator of citrate/malate metabolism